MPARRPKTTAKPGTLAYRLHVGRLNERFTQGELAEEIGTTRSALAKYESGRMVVPWPVAWAWARRLDCNLRWLAAGKGPQQPYVPPEEMGADLAALKSAAQAGATFPDVYARLIENPAEKWHGKTSDQNLALRTLKGGPDAVMRRLPWKLLRSTIQSFADVIAATTSEQQLVETLPALAAALAEMKRRLREKHPHLASRL